MLKLPFPEIGLIYQIIKHVQAQIIITKPLIVSKILYDRVDKTNSVLLFGLALRFDGFEYGKEEILTAEVILGSLVIK